MGRAGFCFLKGPRSITGSRTECVVLIRCCKKQETKPCPGYKRFIAYKNKLPNPKPHKTQEPCMTIAMNTRAHSSNSSRKRQTSMAAGGQLPALPTRGRRACCTASFYQLLEKSSLPSVYWLVAIISPISHRGGLLFESGLSTHGAVL